MGSATTQARATVVEALRAATGVDLDVARELFAAARTVGASSHLSGALADSSAPAAARAGVVTAVFGPSFAPATVALLRAVVVERWSSVDELVEGLEELAIRATAVADTQSDVEGELFQFSRTVAANGDLELALGSRVGEPSAKGALVARLLENRVSAAAVLIASSLVQQPRDRRVRSLLRWAERLVAEQRDRVVATVYAATALSDDQAARLRSALGARYGIAVTLNTVIDPTVVGGLRVQIADDVIDASVSTRLADLRQRIAG